MLLRSSEHELNEQLHERAWHDRQRTHERALHEPGAPGPGASRSLTHPHWLRYRDDTGPELRAAAGHEHRLRAAVRERAGAQQRALSGHYTLALVLKCV